MTPPGQRLRDAWNEGPIMIPGAFNALSAMMCERLGFSAVYLSGGALSAGSVGVPDIGLVTLTEFAEAASLLVNASRLPLLCDADTGFGEILNVERTIQVFERVGAAGVHLEDQVLPKRCGHLSGKSLVSVKVMRSKIMAATTARRDPSFVIIARTDARSVEGFDAAVDRAHAYLEAGADAIFPEALETEAEFAEFAQRVKAPLLANMTEFGRGPLLPFEALSGMGYRMVLYPLTAFRSAMRAAFETLSELRERGSQSGRLYSMQSRAELYSLIDYQGWEARDRSYFGP